MNSMNQTTHTREFYCNTCDPESKEKPMTPTEAKAHLLEAHKIESMEAQRQGVQFLDGADFYSNVFKWTFSAPDVGEVNLTEVSSGPRSNHHL